MDLQPNAALGRLVSELTKFLTDNRYLIETSDNINVKLLEQRSVYMNQLTTIKNTLTTWVENMDSTYKTVEKAHSLETHALDALLSKMRSGPVMSAGNVSTGIASTNMFMSATPQHAEPKRILKNTSTMRGDATPWTLVQRKPKPGQMTEINKTERIPSKPVLGPPKVDSPAESRYSRVKITEGLYVPAIHVPSFADVKQDGNLYFIERSEHFAFKIAGYMFHGNIGVIYTESTEPEKIKDCKYVGTCTKENCPYYHDPALFDGSCDQRNFIASSFIYTPPHSAYKNKSRSRRFGSRDHLETDIVGLSEEERSRFYDQTMHDFLCAMLLKNTGKN